MGIEWEAEEEGEKAGGRESEVLTLTGQEDSRRGRREG